MTTIYTSKKTGATYTMKALENGKFQLTSTEDNTDIITTTESVLKRWYKKSIVVDFTKAEEKPKKTRRANRTSKVSFTKKAAEVKKGAFLDFYAKPGIPYDIINIDSVDELFPEITVDYENGFVSSSAFNRHRRAYVNVETGNIAFRAYNKLFEINGLKAYL